jgi:hypothetical protein
MSLPYYQVIQYHIERCVENGLIALLLPELDVEATFVIADPPVRFSYVLHIISNSRHNTYLGLSVFAPALFTLARTKSVYPWVIITTRQLILYHATQPATAFFRKKLPYLSSHLRFYAHTYLPIGSQDTGYERPKTHPARLTTHEEKVLKKYQLLLTFAENG